MSKLSLQYDIANFTPADANPVEANYNKLEQHVNQEIIERDGSVAMRAELLLADDPVQALGAATKHYVDLLLPIGVMIPFGGATTPLGGKWLACDGAELEVAGYQALFDVIGTRFVAGTVAAGRFNVPDMRQRVPLGAQAGAVEPGSRGGSADAPLVQHAHGMENHTHGMKSHVHHYNHYHSAAGHTHRVDIWSGGASARHHHGTVSYDTVQFTPNPGFYLSTEPPNNYLGAGIINPSNFSTGGDDPEHTHAINGVSGDGSGNTNWVNAAGSGGMGAGPGGDGNTGGPSDNLTDGVSAAYNTLNAGTASATNANLPPYVAVMWVIRAA